MDCLTLIFINDPSLSMSLSLPSLSLLSGYVNHSKLKRRGEGEKGA